MSSGRRATFGLRLGSSLIALLVAASAAAQAVTQPAAGASEAARAALQSFDMRRLVRDRAYAEEMLRHVETLDADEAGWPYAEDRAGIRLMALAALARREEAKAGIDRFVAAGSSEVQPNIDAWWSALIMEDHARAVSVLDGASRHVRGVDWPELRRQMGPSAPRALLGRLTGAAGRPLRVRLAAALLRIGWPGDSDRVAGDDLRMMLLDDRLAQGDASGAAEIAGAIRTPPAILPLIVLRRYDAVIGADRDRLALLRDSLAEEDRETQAAIAVREPSVDHLLARERYLRAVGRDAEAWTLAEPMMRDVAATAALGNNGVWLISDAIDALDALGRKDEAAALARRLVAVPLSVNGELIGVYINHIDFLSSAGLHAEALDHARLVERDHAGRANAYGRMWISAGIVCALAGLDRAGEAAPVLARMLQTSEDNLAALTRAQLCLGDMAAAEALLIRRLADPETVSVPFAFQQFELDDDRPEPGSRAARMRALQERPAVRAALDRVARTLRLPLAAYTWN